MEFSCVKRKSLLEKTDGNDHGARLFLLTISSYEIRSKTFVTYVILHVFDLPIFTIIDVN